MKADRIKMYLDMYYNAEIPTILERETETEKAKMKEKIKHLVENINSELWEHEKKKLFEKIDEM